MAESENVVAYSREALMSNTQSQLSELDIATAPSVETMSKASIDRYLRAASDQAAESQLLGDVALGTVLDPELHRAVAARPWTVDAIARQVRFVARTVDYCKSRALHRLSGQKRAFEQRTCAGSSPLQTNIVVVGLGSVGTKIVEALLAGQCFHGSSISVISRQSTFPKVFEQAGVRCFQDFSEVQSSSDFAVVACQPGQFPAAAKQMRESHKVLPTCVVMSVCAGVTSDKVASELNHPCSLVANVDTARASQRALAWLEEDTRIASQRRVEYAATKSIIHQSQSDQAVIDTSEAEASSHTRRSDDARRLACPADPASFFHRALHCIAVTVNRRGLSVSEALGISTEALLGFRVEIESKDTELGELSGIDNVAKHAQLTTPQLLERFLHQMVA